MIDFTFNIEMAWPSVEPMSADLKDHSWKINSEDTGCDACIYLICSVCNVKIYRNCEDKYCYFYSFSEAVYTCNELVLMKVLT
jgi:hypothetical protein